MPGLRKEHVLAILCSDIHLSHTPPLARSAEPDWYAAMSRQLIELDALAGRCECPIVYAGDIFDRWNAPPELINFALEYLPQGYAVPGQHDLPLHNPNDISKSAYWTLVTTNSLCNLRAGKTRKVADGFYLTGFPWGSLLESTEPPRFGFFRLAVVHKYCWLPRHNPAQKDAGFAPAIKQHLNGFDAIVVGDNHSGFISGNLINCGTFFRRRIDERNYRPMIGLLLASGKIVPYYMDVSQDKFIEQVDESMKVLRYSGFSEFVTELERLESDGLDFVDALKQAMKITLNEEGRKLILEALEEVVR